MDLTILSSLLEKLLPAPPQSRSLKELNELIQFGNDREYCQDDKRIIFGDDTTPINNSRIQFSDEKTSRPTSSETQTGETPETIVSNLLTNLRTITIQLDNWLSDPIRYQQQLAQAAEALEPFHLEIWQIKKDGYRNFEATLQLLRPLNSTLIETERPNQPPFNTPDDPIHALQSIINQIIGKIED